LNIYKNGQMSTISVQGRDSTMLVMAIESNTVGE